MRLSCPGEPQPDALRLPPAVSCQSLRPAPALGVAAALNRSPVLECVDVWPPGRAPRLSDVGGAGARQYAYLGARVSPACGICPVAYLADLAGGVPRTAHHHAGDL